MPVYVFTYFACKRKIVLNMNKNRSIMIMFCDIRDVSIIVFQREVCWKNNMRDIGATACMFKFRGGGGGVQIFRLKSRDFCQPVQGSDLSKLASMKVSTLI